MTGRLSSKKSIRILNVVGSMNPGGVETWLLNILKNIDKEKFQNDFLVHRDTPGYYDKELIRLGSTIRVCKGYRQPVAYASRFKKIVREGEYDVVHSHVHHFSGFVLRLASKAKVPVRIAHSHNDTKNLQTRSSFLKKMYFALMKYWIHRYANVGLACSKQAGEALFEKWTKSHFHWEILPYGIDLSLFDSIGNSDKMRGEFGFESDNFVIGHIGRFAPQKNHNFIVDCFKKLHKLEPSARLLLVGDGPLRVNIEKQIEEAGLSRCVVFAGLRNDIPKLLNSVMDVFFFPSLYEGLGLVLMEAQAAGLPSVASDTIPREATIVKNLVSCLPLDAAPDRWAQELLRYRTFKRSTSVRMNAMKSLKNSSFNIQRTTLALQNEYYNPL